MSARVSAALFEDLVRYRRHFHAHPELSLVEFETARFIERALRGFGFDAIRTGVGTTGILATLRGGKPGPVTLLRADMDGLPVEELNEPNERGLADRTSCKSRCRAGRSV